MKTVMTSLLHQNILQHLLMAGLAHRTWSRVSSVNIVAEIVIHLNINQMASRILNHLSYWSLVMNLSMWQWTIHDKKFPSHTSHMNLTPWTMEAAIMMRSVDTRASSFMLALPFTCHNWHCCCCATAPPTTTTAPVLCQPCHRHCIGVSNTTQQSFIKHH